MRKIAALCGALVIVAIFCVCTKPLEDSEGPLSQIGFPRTFKCLVKGPTNGLGIMVNGIDTKKSTPDEIDLTAGDVVFAEGIFNGAWVVRGDEKYIKFYKDEFSKGYRLYVNVGNGKRFIGYAFKPIINQAQFDKYVQSRTTLRVVTAFDNTYISSISSLSSQPKLFALGLKGVDISNISDIANTTELRVLNLAGTKAFNLVALENLTKLRVLSLVGSNVSDVSPLKNLKELRKLMLSNTVVADISALAELKNLRILEVAKTAVADISPLAGLNDLEELDISMTRVSHENFDALKFQLPNCKIKFSY